MPLYSPTTTRYLWRKVLGSAAEGFKAFVGRALRQSEVSNLHVDDALLLAAATAAAAAVRNIEQNVLGLKDDSNEVKERETKEKEEDALSEDQQEVWKTEKPHQQSSLKKPLVICRLKYRHRH
jgi:hypothetical protein